MQMLNYAFPLILSQAYFLHLHVPAANFKLYPISYDSAYSIPVRNYRKQPKIKICFPFSAIWSLNCRQIVKSSNQFIHFETS